MRGQKIRVISARRANRKERFLYEAKEINGIVEKGGVKEMSNLPVPQGSLGTYLVEINRFPLLNQEEAYRLATRYRKTGDIEAAHQLVTSNLRFVVKIAYEYSSYGLRMADLIQEGNVGLMIAVKKFDPTKGYRLISYAVWWIRAMIQNFILKSWSLVKIGTTQAQRKLFYKLGQTKRALARFLSDGKTLTDDDCHAVAKSLKVRDEDVMEMEARLKARDTSLDQPFHEESPTTPLDLLASHENQEDLLARTEENQKVRSEVERALTVLNEKERFIVEKRLMTDEPLTLQEIGDRFHISRERARQLEERAKKKIRNLFEKILIFILFAFLLSCAKKPFLTSSKSGEEAYQELWLGEWLCESCFVEHFHYRERVLNAFKNSTILDSYKKYEKIEETAQEEYKKAINLVTVQPL